MIKFLNVSYDNLDLFKNFCVCDIFNVWLISW